ncbi:MAG: type I-C CRISPR-associated endonuclease Cas1, partial [Lentisphaerae bacterium]|nr:type I-C CRISPR-associated endonuclease Cas1 [Lentisphaerota bacterium]
FLSENGKFLPRLTGPDSGNVLLRNTQFFKADNEEESHAIAKNIILAKIANSRIILQRFIRDHGEGKDTEALSYAIKHLSQLGRKVQRSFNLDFLRGIEGEAGKTYFSVFSELILAQKESFRFDSRNRRPPLDNVNALLSFVYTLLANDCTSALESVGLDPQVGFLHRMRSGRPSLALDLMEEFRAFFADRLVLSLINLRQIDERGFILSETGAVEMTDDTRKTVLVAYQKRKQEVTRHPFILENAKLGVFFHIQAALLARYLRGDLDGYPPLFWK